MTGSTRTSVSVPLALAIAVVLAVVTMERERDGSFDEAGHFGHCIESVVYFGRVKKQEQPQRRRVRRGNGKKGEVHENLPIPNNAFLCALCASAVALVS